MEISELPTPESLYPDSFDIFGFRIYACKFCTQTRFFYKFDVNKAIMRCLVKNLAMFGLGLYVYAGEDLPEDAAPQPEAEPQKQPKPRPAAPKQEQPPVPCICARCNQPIKRVKLKDGSIMQAAEFAATHEGMCADCYKATRLNVA